jgi:hypothetical protein
MLGFTGIAMHPLNITTHRRFDGMCQHQLATRAPAIDIGSDTNVAHSSPQTPYQSETRVLASHMPIDKGGL